MLKSSLPMKRLSSWISIATIALALVACSPESKGEIQPTQETPGQTEPQQGKTETIAGTTIAATNNAAGQVIDSKTGKGIQGVTVTDGYTCVQTDANGVYQLKQNIMARNIYITVPSAYKIPLKDDTHYPYFYRTLPSQKTTLTRNDFELEPLDKPETQFTMVMIGDPQCKQTDHVYRYRDETIEDIRSTLGEARESGKYPNAYAMTLGDIVHDTPNLWEDMTISMSNVKIGSDYLPFFQCIGNHDHNATRAESDHAATTDYVNHFGPTDYSFDRGDVHIVVMDNIIGTSSSGTTWTYSAGFSDSQFGWLRQDLSFVKDKDKKMIFLCCHIPFRAGANSGGSSVNRDKYYEEVLNLLTQFKEAHIMIGHTHYSQNYIHTSYLCKGGQPIYEHIHQAACGAWWAANSSVSGAPNGYNIYEIDGPTIVNWLNKGTGRDASYQLRVFDGNQIYTGTKGYTYSWFEESNIGGKAGIESIGNPLLKNCFVAEIWDDDSMNVTVEFWQGGKKVGDFTRLDDKTCTNIPLCSFWFNEKNKNTSTWASKTSSHYWYFKPASGDPSAEKDWEVKVTRVIPSSGVENHWSRSDLTVDYSEF